LSGIRSGLSVFVALVLLTGATASVARARTLAQVLDRKVFSICAHPDAEPFSSKDSVPAGLQVDLAQAIARDLEVRLEIKWILFRRDARQVGCDALIGSVAVEGGDASRPQAASTSPSGGVLRIAVTHPYARQAMRVVLPAVTAPLASLDDLRGRIVAVPHASLAHFVLYQDGIAVRTRYRSSADILDAVAAGEVGAGLVSDWEYGWYRKMHSTSGLQQPAEPVVDPQLDFDVAITLRNTDPALLERVNAILDHLAKNGTLTGIFTEYGIMYQAPHAR
jgi:polar amino acid transport system substrate-binding protein